MRRPAAPLAPWVVGLSGWLGMCLAAPPLWAQAPARLAREFQEGVDAYRLGDYDTARVHLEKARAMDASLPGPHRFLAAVAKAQDRFAECVSHAAVALRVAPQSREVPDTRKLHEECRAADGRPSFGGSYGDGGALAVTAREDGASAAVPVRLNGKVIGSTPLFPRALAAGEHELRVGTARAQQVQILPGVVTDVSLEVSREGAAASPSLPAAPGWITLPASLVAIEGLRVVVDGARVSASSKVELAPGRHRLTITRPGHPPWSTTVDITEGRSVPVLPIFADHKPQKPPKKAVRSR